MKSAIVIGSGFGGLALAIRLQSAGVATTIVEARDRPGGRAYYWEKDGFTFDAGPTVITDPACLQELWALTGADMARERHAVLHRMNFESPYLDMPSRLTVRQNLTVFGKLYAVENLSARVGRNLNSRIAETHRTEIAGPGSRAAPG